MTRTAGFGVVISAQRGAVATAIAMLRRSNVFVHRPIATSGDLGDEFVVTETPLETGPGTSFGGWGVDAYIEFGNVGNWSESDPTRGGVTAPVRAWGHVAQRSGDSGLTEHASVRWSFELDVDLGVAVERSAESPARLVAVGSNASVRNVVSTIFASPVPGSAPSAALRERIDGLPGLFSFAVGGGVLRAPIDVGFLRPLLPIAGQPEVAFTANDATVGINIFGTQGDRARLESLGSDVAVALDPFSIDVALQGVERTLRKALRERLDADLQFFSIVPVEGALLLRGTVGKTGGSATFSVEYVLHVDPVVGIRLEQRALSVDVDKTWWADALSFVSIGLSDALLGSSNPDAVIDEVNGGPALSFAPKRIELFPKAGYVRIAPDRLEIDHAGMEIGFSVRDLSERGHLSMSETVDVRGPLFASLELPADVAVGTTRFPADPLLRVRWMVRLSNGSPIHVEDGSAQTHRTLRFVPPDAVAGFSGTGELHVEVRVYRVFGGRIGNLGDIGDIGSEVEEVFFDRATARVTDFLDLSRPFFRWTHQVRTPQVEVQPSGQRLQTGRPIRTRVSKIHRTDFVERCRSVVYAAEPFRKRFPEFPPNTIDYFDALPFPIAQIGVRANRRLLCDYCFFGGPDKTEPRI